jgi:hypothetical protein
MPLKVATMGDGSRHPREAPADELLWLLPVPLDQSSPEVFIQPKSTVIWCFLEGVAEQVKRFHLNNPYIHACTHTFDPCFVNKLRSKIPQYVESFISRRPIRNDAISCS